MTPDVAPSIEEEIRAALTEVAECVAVEQRPTIGTDNDIRPHTSRARVLMLAGIAAVLAITVAVAVRATDTRDAPTTPNSHAAPFVDDGPLVTPRFYRGGAVALLPPEPGTQPRVSAAEAYRARLGFPWRHEPMRPHLVLARATIFDYGAAHNDGTVTPFIDDRLAWVVTYENVPRSSIGGPGGPAPRRGVTTVPTTAPAASGQTVLVFVDATTGRALDAQSTPGVYSTVPLTCPTNVPATRRHQAAGTATTMVPGHPVALLACRYDIASQVPGRSLARSAHLDPSPIAAALNAQPRIHQPAAYNCAPSRRGTIVLLFGYADRARLTVSIEGNACAFASNGDRTVGTPATLLARLETALGHRSPN
jgi:hypothetical protein